MSRSIVTLLEQTEIWRGQDGRVYRLGELEDGHIDAIVRMLDRRAASLLEHRRWYDEFHGHPALGRVSELESVDATAWLRDRPLYRALCAEQRRRGALDGEVVANAAEVEAGQLRLEVAEEVRRVAATHADLPDERKDADPALSELGQLLSRYHDAIRRLGEL